LFLFELKKNGNEKLGVLSELFFYSYVMADVQTGRFKFWKSNLEIEQTESISSYILAQKCHPLIDETILSMVNQAFKEIGLNIRFGSVKIEQQPLNYSVKVKA